MLHIKGLNYYKIKCKIFMFILKWYIFVRVEILKFNCHVSFKIYEKRKNLKPLFLTLSTNIPRI